ncbi:hypothetical protein VNO80_25317 [Phaseolus coccineus]|uniref:Uncharacterized protein n=1 Tax=Phaseolus coccineus TaxID=3886 RepID=A0AAN9LZ96_PHACN
MGLNSKCSSRTCQHFDWRSGHKFQCHVEKANSNQVVNPENSYELEDNVHSSSPLCLECYSGSRSSRALIPTSLSQEATKNNQKEVEEQLRSLKEELTKIKDENKWLRSERDEWEVRTRNSIDRLYSFRKENEHQLFILKHENELMSNAEKQATQMVNSLSQCLQIAVESGVEERQKQEEYIHMLQSNKDTRQKLVNASSEIAAVESNAAGAECSSRRHFVTLDEFCPSQINDSAHDLSNFDFPSA